MNHRILVVGANGQLGMEMRNVSVKSEHSFIFSDINEIDGLETTKLDITDIEAIRHLILSEKITVIVNCAAYTNVDAAEDDYDSANLLNHLAVENLAVVAKEAGVVLIHISTDYVFKGDRCIPYNEECETNPLGVYGKTKLAGERSIIKSGCKYIILRTAWLYSPYGKNFVKTMKFLTSTKDKLNVVFDQVGTPTYAKDLASLILHIIETEQLDKTGIYHFSNEGVCSWYDFAKVIAECSKNTCDIRPCHSDEFPSKVMRPNYSVLDKTKVKKSFGIEIPYWKDSLNDCIKRLD